jgi:hypothetical protein
MRPTGLSNMSARAGAAAKVTEPCEKAMRCHLSQGKSGFGNSLSFFELKPTVMNKLLGIPAFLLAAGVNASDMVVVVHTRDAVVRQVRYVCATNSAYPITWTAQVSSVPGSASWHVSGGVPPYRLVGEDSPARGSVCFTVMDSEGRTATGCGVIGSICSTTTETRDCSRELVPDPTAVPDAMPKSDGAKKVVPKGPVVKRPERNDPTEVRPQRPHSEKPTARPSGGPARITHSKRPETVAPPVERSTVRPTNERSVPVHAAPARAYDRR